MRLVFTGGGSAGHVMPNIAIISHFRELGAHISYIGSHDGVEHDIIAPLNIPYHSIQSGKLRRYFSWKNFTDPFKILFGIFQAWCALGKCKPQLVFSKGGFVAFPVVFAAWLRRLPVIAHESDFSPGLANRLSFPFVHTICVSFSEAKRFFKDKDKDKIVVTGNPIRPRLLHGSASCAKTLCQFSDDKPVLLVMGGGQGAARINAALQESSAALLQQFNIIHLCGKGKSNMAFNNIPGFQQFEFVDEPLPDIFALSDIIISRSGANSLYEILALGKPHILIPLPLTASRGDQIHNAKHFKDKGISYVIDEEDLTAAHLQKTIAEVFIHREAIQTKIANLQLPNSVALIADVIDKAIVN